MKKSTLKIVEQDGRITVKKKPNLSSVVITIFVWLATIILPILVLEKIDITQDKFFYLFLTVYALCVFTNLTYTIKAFFGKVVIDKYGKALLIYNPIKRARYFNEITNIKLYHKEDNEAIDRHGVIIQLDTGKRIIMQTSSKKQAEELETLLKSYINIVAENEDNKDDI